MHAPSWLFLFCLEPCPVTPSFICSWFCTDLGSWLYGFPGLYSPNIYIRILAFLSPLPHGCLLPSSPNLFLSGGRNQMGRNDISELFWNEPPSLKKGAAGGGWWKRPDPILKRDLHLREGLRNEMLIRVGGEKLGDEKNPSPEGSTKKEPAELRHPPSLWQQA